VAGMPVQTVGEEAARGPVRSEPLTPGPRSDQIRAQLEHILEAREFAGAPSLCRLLRFVVEKTLLGEAGHIKEYLLGVEVFRRGEEFDPRLDPIVRVQAAKLRARMRRYYEGDGRRDEVIIDLPKGAYIPVFSLRDSGSANGKRQAAAPGGAPAKSDALVVALLPFTRLGTTAEDGCFCESLEEELTSCLTASPHVRVVSRVSTLRFQGHAADVRQIGSELNAAVLLEGSLTKQGSHCRLILRAVSAASGYHLWSGRYEVEILDPFAGPARLAAEVCLELRSALLDDGGPRHSLLQQPAVPPATASYSVA